MVSTQERRERARRKEERVVSLLNHVRLLPVLEELNYNLTLVAFSVAKFKDIDKLREVDACIKTVAKLIKIVGGEK